MPCALTEPDNYPDYLKDILKEVANGADKDLKACACHLRDVFDSEEECILLDEDGKKAAFPFCITEEEDVGPLTARPLGFSIKQIMKMYWLGFDIDINISVNTIIVANYCAQLEGSPDSPDSYVTNGNKKINFIFNKTLTNKVCGTSMYNSNTYTITRWPDSGNPQTQFTFDINLSDMVYNSNTELFYPAIFFGLEVGGGEYRATYINDNIGKSLGQSIFYIEENPTILPNCWGSSDDILSCPPPNRVGASFGGSVGLFSKININQS